MTPAVSKRSDLPADLKDRREIACDAKFPFGCHPGLSCFTDCCADVSILLAPWDVVRLARRLEMSTTEFLDRHTHVPITKDLHLPVVMLKMDDSEKRRCPFVGEQGCTIYEDRPWSCRMYPLGMGLPPARAGEEPEPVYFLFEDDFCKGRFESSEWTVDSWRTDQGVVEQEALETGFRDLVTHPYFIGGRQLDPKRIEMFHMGCYDLDRFRAFVFESSFLKRFAVDEKTVEAMRADDAELLKFAFVWLRLGLFGEPTIPARDNADENRSQA